MYKLEPILDTRAQLLKSKDKAKVRYLKEELDIGLEATYLVGVVLLRAKATAT